MFLFLIISNNYYVLENIYAIYLFKNRNSIYISLKSYAAFYIEQSITLKLYYHLDIFQTSAVTA